MTETATLMEAPQLSSEPRLDLDRHVPALCLTLGGKLALHAKRHSAKQLGLDLCEWRIVQVLGAEERATVFHIADCIAMDRGGASRAISRLEKTGIVAREDDPSDRRKSLIALTEKGWDLHATIIGFALAREERLLSTLSEPDRQRLRKMLIALIVEADSMIVEGWTPT